MKLWRICKRRHAATAFSGEGARLASGRWNSLGVPMVYTSLSLSLAVLEVFVHLDPEDEPDDLVSVMAEVPKDESSLDQEKQMMLTRLKLRQNWRAEGNRENQQMGDAWIQSKASFSLVVPSVVVDGEWNALVNPEHPDAARVNVVEAKAFRFDVRMFRP